MSSGINIKEIVSREGASDNAIGNNTDRETHIKIPRFTKNGERIYMLSVTDIAKYCGMKRQNVTHYCRNNPDVFYRVERLGQKDARILGIPYTPDDDKMRTYLIYVTRQQMEVIKPFAQGRKKKK